MIVKIGAIPLTTVTLRYGVVASDRRGDMFKEQGYQQGEHFQ